MEKPNTPSADSSLTWRAEFARMKGGTDAEFNRALIQFAAALLLLVLGTIVLATGFWVITILAMIVAVGIAAMGCMNFVDLFWREWRCLRKPFRPFCPHCGKYIPCNLDWKCDSCDAVNTKGRVFSFLSSCEHCDAVPKAYRCHHPRCGKSIYLDTDRDDQHCATFGQGKQDVSLENPTEKKNKIKAEIEFTRLETEFAKAKAELEEASKPRVPLNRREAALKNMLDEMETLKSKSDLMNKKKMEWEAEARRLPADERDAALEKIEEIFADARMKYL